MGLIKIFFKNKSRELKIKKLSFLGRFLGLMFSRRNTDNLLFEFDKDVRISVHSLFVFFPFLILWLNHRNEVVDFKIIKPFCFYANSKKKYRKFLEIPFNFRNKKDIKFFLGILPSISKDLYSFDFL